MSLDERNRGAARFENDRDGLIDTVAQIIRETQPVLVRTLEVAATHGRDHSDHMLVGALSLLAIARANSRADVLAYRGYSTAEEPPTCCSGWVAKPRRCDRLRSPSSAAPQE